tara:strand:+ start:505 stop:900 length:396 start_codon:yes stop_codon:yes gene_type:complete
MSNVRKTRPLPRIPGKPIPKPKMIKRKVKTQVVDPVNPRAPKGKLNKGAAEPMDTKTRVPAGQNRRSGLAGMLKRGKSTKEKENSNTQSSGGGTIGVSKGPGFKDGGAVNKRKATGAAKRGFGKAYMKGKR